jgi:hypothetical protein
MCAVPTPRVHSFSGAAPADPVSVEAMIESYEPRPSFQSWSHRHRAGGDLSPSDSWLAFNRAPTDAGSVES